MASRAIDLLITYRVIKLLVTPWEKQEAYAFGIIDNRGKVLRKSKTLKTSKERKSYTILHRFVFNLKRILQRVGLKSKLAAFGGAMALLIREDKSYVKHQMVLESAVIKWLKEMGEYERVLLEEREEKPIIEGVKPMCTAFGIDIYELNGELYPEEEYGRLQKV